MGCGNTHKKRMKPKKSKGKGRRPPGKKGQQATLKKQALEARGTVTVGWLYHRTQISQKDRLG